ncbi:hypothetical protein [Gayadomonas joobiniege]|uniref:hypothetical protein n=1 Tax=Gayadomonas joobiniege TaxID=1234606 RepID=UPI000A46E7B1|nr:hypothetical protein [Gayadomonas joobiniege]
MIQSQDTQMLIQQMVRAQSLPPQFETSAQRWYLPLCRQILARQKNKQGTLYVAINGCQGSGKSTMAKFVEMILTQIHGLTVANLSIDDFYLTRKEREHLAAHIHPLLITRGVPGTHDIPLAINTLKNLASDHKSISLVRFNKAIDDRAEPEDWQKIDGPADVVILEGWCVGLSAQSESELYDPINELESREDANCRWRNYVNEQMRDHYSDLFDMFDMLIMLQAPSFDCVFQWRSLQEQKLRQHARFGTHIMDDHELARFIQHYQRLTEHALNTLPQQADIVFKMSEYQTFTQVHGLEVK